MKIEELSLSAIYEYGNNSRTHSDEQIDQIVRSINEFGFTNPILINKDGRIIAGHGRYQAAVKMKLAKVPCIRLTQLSERQERAYVIADNKLALNSGWDFQKLTEEIDALVGLDFDMDLLGFNEQELDAILKNDFDLFSGGETVDVAGYTRKKHADIVEDEPPIEAAEPIAKLGDLYQLGRHRLFCGDSRVKRNVDILLDGAVPNIMVTDPPYGVNYDASWRNEIEGHGDAKLAVGKVENDNLASWPETYRNFPGNIAYVWHTGIHAPTVFKDLADEGFTVRSQIIWVKNHFVISRGAYHWQHEPCWYAVRNGEKADWIGDRSQSTTWKIDKQLKNETGHSTQKPVECMAKPMQNHEGDVFDPFVGSGTSIIAAEQTDRTCYAMEISPAHCDIIIERWEAFSGESAVLLGNYLENEG